MSDAPHNVSETSSETGSVTEALARPEAILRVPVGLASPLWGLFAGAAITGSAWWWMTRFTRAENLEAMFGAAESRAAKAAALPLPAEEAAVAAALETLGAVEDAVETVVEPAVEAAEQAAAGQVDGALEAVLSDPPPATVLEALEAGPEALEPVGGESAPISPVVADLADEPADAEPVRIRRRTKGE